jgi:hypothetical protein
VFEGNPITAFDSPPADLGVDSHAERFADSTISCASPISGVGRCPTRSHEPLASPSGAIAGLRSMLKGPATMEALCAMPITDGYELVNGCRPPLHGRFESETDKNLTTQQPYACLFENNGTWKIQE